MFQLHTQVSSPGPLKCQDLLEGVDGQSVGDQEPYMPPMNPSLQRSLLCSSGSGLRWDWGSARVRALPGHSLHACVLSCA